MGERRQLEGLIPSWNAQKFMQNPPSELELADVGRVRY